MANQEMKHDFKSSNQVQDPTKKCMDDTVWIVNICKQSQCGLAFPLLGSSLLQTTVFRIVFGCKLQQLPFTLNSRLLDVFFVSFNLQRAASALYQLCIIYTFISFLRYFSCLVSLM